MGLLRCDALLGCVDNGAARQCNNNASIRLGTTCIDAAVERNGDLVRVSAFRPGPDAPCLECAWSSDSYTNLDQSIPCQPRAAAPPTRAPAALGALAASLGVLEVRKVLAGHWNDVAVGRQITISARYHAHYDTLIRRNPDCRCDHAVWPVTPLDCDPSQLTVERALSLGPSASRDEARQLSVEGQTFVRRLACTRCGRSRTMLRLQRRLTTRQQVCCRCCQRSMASVSFDELPALQGSSLTPDLAGRTLGELGFLPGDIFSVRADDQVRHYEIQGGLTLPAQRRRANQAAHDTVEAST